MSENDVSLKISIFKPDGTLFASQAGNIFAGGREFFLGIIPSGYLVVVENEGPKHFAGNIFGAFLVSEGSYRPVGKRVTLLGRGYHSALFGSRGGTLEYSVFCKGEGFSALGGFSGGRKRR